MPAGVKCLSDSPELGLEEPTSHGQSVDAWLRMIWFWVARFHCALTVTVTL